MAKFQEKKYKVSSFDTIINALAIVGAKEVPQITTIHHYARHNGKDVIKLVEYEDRIEIHILEDIGGKFVMKEKFGVATKEEGFNWLNNKGYTQFDTVKMVYTDYEYKGGIVGLYTINDSLKSVILDYPSDMHDVIEKEMSLENAELITMPFNKLISNEVQN